MAFDARGAVRFDLARGAVVQSGASGAGDARAVLVSEDALAELIAAAGASVGAEAARRLGADVGRRLAERLGGSRGVRASTLDEIADELGGELAVRGLGTLAIERWGRALVLRVDNAPGIEPGFFAALLQGALEHAAGRSVRCAAVATPSGGPLRVLVAREETLARVRSWLAAGIAWADALARLQSSAEGPP